MKYILFVLLGIIGLVLAYILLLAISTRFVNTKKVYDTNNRYFRFLLASSTAMALPLLRVKIHVTGMELVPENSRFLLVGNHRSKFDSIVTWHVLRKQNISYISKPENFKVPGYGRVIRKCAFLPIDRENPRNALTTINKAVQLLKNDVVSIGVYPEGTRSHDGSLLPFRDGVFKIAQKAQVPILVLAIRGAENICQNWYKRRTDVYVDFIDLIEPEKVCSLKTVQIGQIIHDELSESLARDPKPVTGYRPDKPGIENS